MEETASPDSSATSTPKRHSRHVSYNRASLPRRSTKGPLDTVDPLAIELPPPSGDTTNAPAEEAATIPIPPTPTHHPLSPEHPKKLPLPPPKDFTYLQRPEIYHSLSQLDLPPPFRAPSHQAPPSTPIPDLVSTSHYRSAAIAAALQLCTSPSLTPDQIFSLLYTRLACLTLINATAFAAQESRCLEDINSPFYRDDVTHKNILPWELRVLAIRLQGIGFNDARRGIAGYYDLAKDARHEISRTKGQERQTWKERLKDLGVRVGNALVETGDLAAAIRHFESLRRKDDSEDELLKSRIALLYLRLGEVAAARRYIPSNPPPDSTTAPNTLIRPLLSMAEARYEDAINEWKDLTSSTPEGDIATQNLAVCLLYTNRLHEAHALLDSLIDKGRSFHALTFNLATVYELRTEKARAKKEELAERVAVGLVGEEGKGGERVAADFKL